MALTADEERVGLVMREMMAIDPGAVELGDPAELRAKAGPRVLSRLDIKIVLAFAAAAILVVALIASGPLRPGSNGPNQTTGSKVKTILPRGWKSYTYRQARISVPGGWAVLRPGGCPDRSEHTGLLILGGTASSILSRNDANSECPILYATDDYVAISPLSALTNVNRTMVNGVTVFTGYASDPTVWEVPSLNVQLAGSGLNSEKVLHTLRPSGLTESDIKRDEIAQVERVLTRVGPAVSTATASSGPNPYETLAVVARSAGFALNSQTYSSSTESKLSALVGALKSLSADADQAAGPQANLAQVAQTVEADYATVASAKADLIQALQADH